MTTPVLIGPPMLSSSAAELLDRITTAPAAPVHAAVAAPGGYGKTLFLRRLAAAYERVGVPVARRWQPGTDPVEQVVLVDDAHLLDPASLDGLSEHAERPEARVVVAHRPWPRPPALTRLLEVLRRGGPPVTLAPLTEAQIAARLAAAVPGPAAGALVGFVAGQTTGVPRYVARLADALGAVGAGAGGSVRVPAAALSPFATELDELDPDLRTLLLAVEAGAGLSFDLVAALLGPGVVVADVVEAGRASGLLTPGGELVPLARQAIAALGAVSQRIDVRQRLAALQLARGGPVLPLVRPLLRVASERAAGERLAGGQGVGDRAGGGRAAEGRDAGADDSDLSGGASHGGPSHGGASSGGASHGGPSHGGASSGRASDGGPSHGGASHGGASHGGASYGGPSHGGGSGGWGADDRASDGWSAGTGLTLVPGAAGSGLGPVYEAAGEEALRDDPALAAELFAAAAGAGRTTLARRAFATALAGDLDQASRLADQVIATGPPEQRAEAAFVAAAVLAHRGQTAQAAMLHEWAAPATVAASGFAAVGLVGVGRLEEAERLARPVVSARPPTSLSAAAALMARGMIESVTGTAGAALSTMVQATTLIEPVGATLLLPDSPAAIGATLALHHAELDVAEAVLSRAVRGGLGGALLAGRHQLLQGWTLLLRGRLAEAERHLDGKVAPYGRDQLFAAALRVGLSRRGSDLVGLRSAWPDACQALIGQPVDLFNLLPLGELAVAAARLGEQHRVAGQLAEAERLLHDLGDPPLWSAPLHWSRLHAAIVADDHEAAARHASALDGVGESGPYAAAAAAAAAIWLEVLGDRADPDAVVAAARGLGALGLTWDATRLVGQAAIRTADRKAMTLLLDTARAMQERGAGAEPAPIGAGARAKTAGQQLLSAREREVAALVLAGLTYKQIADRLYLSAKTVEHHIARIRQRLGCTDRQQLLTRLRELIDGEGAR